MQKYKVEERKKDLLIYNKLSFVYRSFDALMYLCLGIVLINWWKKHTKIAYQHISDGKQNSGERVATTVTPLPLILQSLFAGWLSVLTVKH